MISAPVPQGRTAQHDLNEESRADGMTFAKRDKTKVIDQLLAARRSAQRLELTLRFRGDDKSAERVWRAATRMSAEIDILIGRAMEEWTGKAAAVIATIDAQQRLLAATIRDIKGNIDTANNVIAAVAAIDDIVATAKDVLAGL